MWFIIILLFANINGVDCLTSFDPENQRFSELDQKYEQKVAELSSGENEGAVRKTLQSDTDWELREESRLCLTMWNRNQIIESTSNLEKPFWENTALITVLGAIIGASIAIVGTEKLRHHYLDKKGKEAIKFAIIRLRDEFIEQRLPFSYRGVSVTYVNQSFSTQEYDGVVSSGTFIYFKINLQDTLNALYFQIKDHNRKLAKVEEFHDKLRTERMLPGRHTVMIEHVGELSVVDNIIEELLVEVEKQLDLFKIENEIKKI